VAVRKLTTGTWICECYPAGRTGRRVRKQFATKGEALAFERHTMDEADNKPWLGEKTDRRSLADIAKLWYNLHGQSLTAGKQAYQKIRLMVEALGNPLPKTSHTTVISACSHNPLLTTSPLATKQ